MRRELAGPSLPRALREARVAVGLTQDQAARRMCVSRKTYRSWERGVRQVSVDWLPRLAASLHLTVEELMALATA